MGSHAIVRTCLEKEGGKECNGEKQRWEQAENSLVNYEWSYFPPCGAETTFVV